MNFLSVGIAMKALAEEPVSGDLGFFHTCEKGVLVVAIDGLGHGIEAAVAAEAAAKVFRENAEEPLHVLFEKCHQELRPTRGAAISAAFFSTENNTMEWAGVGNVEGVLFRSDKENSRESLLLRNGIVGGSFMSLRTAVRSVEPGDTLIFTSDGIRPDFLVNLPLAKSPSELARFILQNHMKGTDDALALVARYLGRKKVFP